MDDDRIERALREGPPDEPSYQPTVGRLLASESDATARQTEGSFESGLARPRAQVRGQSLGLSRWSAAIAAALVIVVAGFALRFADVGTPSATPGDLLARIRAEGKVHVVVSNQAPQVPGAGGAYVGFDVDVANAIAAKLGVEADISPIAPQVILTESRRWDLAFPSVDLTNANGAYISAAPYYSWPSWLVVDEGSSVSRVDELAGQAICVVEGSAGATWLSGAIPANAAQVVLRPDGATSVSRPDDAACFAAIQAGEAAAAVTSALFDTELAGSGMRTVVAQPVIVQGRPLLVRTIADLDSSSFRRAVEQAVADLRASGELAELSLRSFGGRDLTAGLP
jgi:ABC-type amino acid transport substrate-binding protein